MVIVLAAPKQKGILDVSIKYDAFAIRKEAEQFNGRDYYYIRMGEYPQTYAGAATSVTGLTETQDKFVCGVSYGTSPTESTFQNKEYNIWRDSLGNKFIKHTINMRYGTGGTFLGGQAINDFEESFFKIESIKWDIIGYFTDDTKTTFIKASDTTNFNPNHTENLVVTSRTALQGMSWYSTNVDVDYLQSNIYSWLRTFENSVLKISQNNKISMVENLYTDTSDNDWGTIANSTTTFASTPAYEYAWVMDYWQALSVFYDERTGYPERRCSPSDFALATYAYQESGYQTIEKATVCTLWLRTSFYLDDASFHNTACLISRGGSVDYHNICNAYYAVRPCLLVNL